MSADDDSRHLSWEQRAAVPAGLVADEPEPARAKTTYAGSGLVDAGSGLVVNQYGMNREDVAAKARKLGWFLVRAANAAATGDTMASMPQLNAHANQLYIDLGHLAEGGVLELGEPLADVYNTLLEQAKQRFPKDKLVETLMPVTEAMHPRVAQALVAQLRLVLGNA
jgi:hypothetical protein